MASIYNIYFGEDIGPGSVRDMLAEAGWVTAVGLRTGIWRRQGGRGMSEVLNWVPIIGWVTSGAITASVTLTIGCLWLYACDAAYQRGESPVSVMKHAFGAS